VARVDALEGVDEVRSPMTTPGWPQEPAAFALVAGADPASGSFLVVADSGDEIGGELQDRVVAELQDSGEELLTPYAVQLTVGGTGLLVDDVLIQVKTDLITGEGIALPLSLLLMVVVFGGFVAAGMPIAG